MVSTILLVIGGNEARPQYLQQAICDASWSTGACILSSVVGTPQQKRQQQQQHILESRRTCFFSYSYVTFWGFCTTTSTTMQLSQKSQNKKYNTEQDQPAVRSAVAAAAATAAAVEKQKQQKMPKARANIYVYSSTLFSGLIFEDEIICIPRTARYVVRKSSRNRRCRKHERTSTYAAVRYFPV